MQFNDGYYALPAHEWQRPSLEGEQLLLDSFADLVADSHMGDGGRYRFRRYGKWRLQHGQLSKIDGSSIYQELHDNPLNGGVERTFAPLAPAQAENPFVEALILADAERLQLPQQQLFEVGFHCVRIVATPEAAGKPTPEGIHRDAEAYTVQHLIDRQGVRGGVFSAYDEDKRPVFHWLQLQRWDSLFFQGTLWHSASPIEGDGHRDILLIDFEPR